MAFHFGNPLDWNQLNSVCLESITKYNSEQQFQSACLKRILENVRESPPLR